MKDIWSPSGTKRATVNSKQYLKYISNLERSSHPQFIENSHPSSSSDPQERLQNVFKIQESELQAIT
jgi:hypothetical protein